MKGLDQKYVRLKEQEERKRVDKIAKTKTVEGLQEFCRYYLGVELTPDQILYEKNSKGKWIRVNRSGNKWGKTFFEALGIILEAYYKIGLETDDPVAWLKSEYLQGVAAPEYSGSKTLLNELVKIVEGNIILPDGNANASKLKGWFIKKKRGLESDSNQPPIIAFFNNSELWGRSYSGLGASMKQKTFHRIIIDESGDIPELHKFIFATLVPRTAMSQTGLISIIGTPQGYKFDYSLVITELTKDPDAYVHQGDTRDNLYITKEAYARLTKAYKHDPVLMMQVLKGELVEVGGAVIPGDVVDHAVDLELPMEQGALKGHRYVGGIDSAMRSDENTITIIDVTRPPFKVVKQFGISAKFLPPETFYAEINSLQRQYNGAYFLFDASGMGGQIMRAALLEMSVNLLFANIVSTKTNAEKEQLNKGDMVVNVREMLTDGRKKQVFYDDEDGMISDIIEENEEYGLIRMPNYAELITQTKIFQWDDKNLATDRFMSFALACWLAKDRISTKVNFERRKRS